MLTTCTCIPSTGIGTCTCIRVRAFRVLASSVLVYLYTTYVRCEYWHRYLYLLVDYLMRVWKLVRFLRASWCRSTILRFSAPVAGHTSNISSTMSAFPFVGVESNNRGRFWVKFVGGPINECWHPLVIKSRLNNLGAVKRLEGLFPPKPEGEPPMEWDKKCVLVGYWSQLSSASQPVPTYWWRRRLMGPTALTC